MSKPPAREQAQVNIRMPDDLRDRIKAAAEANNRSMNAEIVASLDERYPSLRVKRLDLLRSVLELELEEQRRLIDFLEESQGDPDTIRVLRRLLATQEKEGQRLQPHELDALLEYLREPRR